MQSLNVPRNLPDTLCMEHKYFLADQLGEMRKQLEKEVGRNCEEATRELNNVKSEMESKRRDLGTRQRNVEPVLVEVLLLLLLLLLFYYYLYYSSY